MLAISPQSSSGDEDIIITDWAADRLSGDPLPDVPAAVVIIEPASVTLPRMKAGDVFNGEFTLTNYGLIRAEELNFTLPSNDQYFTYEFLGGLPETLEAKERITVPYRVICLQSLDQEEEGTGGAGDCSTYSKCAVVDYAYVCINGVWRWVAIQHCWTTTYGECGGGSVPPTPTGGGRRSGSHHKY